MQRTLGTRLPKEDPFAIRMLMLSACLLATTLQTYSFPSMSFKITVRLLVIRIAGNEQNQGLGFHAASNRGGLGSRPGNEANTYHLLPMFCAVRT